MYKKTNQKGFTLIELLIVIVIIGILSGVLISVIDPVRQQNRARNSSIRASMMKVGFAINTAHSGLGKLPPNAQLSEEIDNVDVSGCTETAVLDCDFTMASANLPSTCGSAYSGTGSVICKFNVVAPMLNGSSFRVIGKTYKLDPNSTTEVDTTYVFDSRDGFYECAATFDAHAASTQTFTNTLADAVTAGKCTLMTE